MTVRSLSEAAADILSRSQSGADKEQMHKLAGAEVQDLGGATVDKPEGNEVGKEASAKITQAAKPGPAPKVGSAPMKKLGGGVAEEVEEDESEEVIEEDQQEESEVPSLEEKRQMIRNKLKAASSCAEDVEAIFAGQDLSEEFKSRVEAIFEAAVIAKAVSVVEEMEAEILEAASESVEAIKEELEEQMSAYASYVAQEWISENKLEVQSGLKQEITEEFIDGLRGLFVEHNINIPDEQIDAVEAMAEEMEEMREELNKAINANLELIEAINEAKKESVIASVCEGLTATQAEKVKTLAEGVEFTTEGEYKEKVAIIKESYFNNQVKQPNVQSPVAVKETLAEDTAQYTESASPLMDRYVSAISRTLVK